MTTNAMYLLFFFFDHIRIGISHRPRIDNIEKVYYTFKCALEWADSARTHTCPRGCYIISAFRRKLRAEHLLFILQPAPVIICSLFSSKIAQPAMVKINIINFRMAPIQPPLYVKIIIFSTVRIIIWINAKV